MNHIIGFTELLLDKNFGDLNEAQADYLSDVHDSSRHLFSPINDILDLSKVEAGKLELQLARSIFGYPLLFFLLFCIDFGRFRCRLDQMLKLYRKGCTKYAQSGWLSGVGGKRREKKLIF